MIKLLYHRDRSIARKIHQIQLLSYKIEANLIGYQDLPPLLETVDDLINSNETYLGYQIDLDIAGVISYEKIEDTIIICKLMIHPHFFQRGIASKLLHYVLQHVGSANKVKVTTGLGISRLLSYT